jgi:hypothetical protein
VSRQAMSAFMQRLYNLQAGLTGTAYTANPTDPAADADEVWTSTGVSVQVTVPPGTQGRILATATSEVGCNNGDNSFAFIVIPATCEMRILLNGSTSGISPDDTVVQESVDAVSDGDLKIDLENVTLQARSDNLLNPGTYTLALQAMFDDSDGSDNTNDMTMSVGDTVLSAQVILQDAT